MYNPEFLKEKNLDDTLLAEKEIVALYRNF
jgi:hypothetical protein